MDEALHIQGQETQSYQTLASPGRSKAGIVIYA